MDLFETMIQHTSVRDFTQQDVPQELKEQLVSAAQSVSSSNFLQAYSIIEIRDPKKLQAIESFSRNPGFISQAGVFYIFVADLQRHARILQAQQKDISHLKTMEPLLVSIIDTTLAAQGMATFAESQGLGICFIGGVRNQIFEVSELLELPPLTVPLFGLAIGYPRNKNQVKQRLPKTIAAPIDRYHFDGMDIKEYDLTMENYYTQRISNQQQTSWSQKVIDFFATAKRPQLNEFLKHQGFTEIK
ncbi:nitroreductase family protein [Enterococcus sp. HY326]|uniref:nitroreductase family protein n=1 Tax=Enterococcus sp. HY326 TaxID=2971265 RepID=UPI002240CC8D|nr:nitroreductase family protein [Enterococcus sp. HY326]